MTTGWATRRGRPTPPPGLTIDADGLRRTGERRPARPAAAPILAVGNSFTFGEEVNDAETWPAHLAALAGRRVLNAGVSGYGFDQIVLRAEELAPRYKPAAIVVGFIADDIRRTEMRRLWGAEKPYFDIAERRSWCCATCRCRRAPDPQHHAHFLAAHAGLFLPVRLHPAPARPAARLVRRPCPRPSRRAPASASPAC